jgi:hypothetical protein
LQLIVVVVVVIIIIIIVLMFLAFVCIETSVFSRSQSGDDPQQVCVVAKVAMIHNKISSIVATS